MVPLYLFCCFEILVLLRNNAKCFATLTAASDDYTAGFK